MRRPDAAEGGLRCLGGGSPPPGIAADLRAIERLPQRARDDLWDVLAPNLAARIDDGAAAAVTAFCQAARVTHADLAGPVRACRFLFRQATANNLSVDDLRADVRDLCGEGASVEDLLVAWYERARTALRQELVLAALAEHGNLAVGVDWRLDTVHMSQGGIALNTPVVLMTFRYRRGDQARRITLQLVPEVIRELQATCNKIMT